MPIDFTLNDDQRRLRREARQFAQDVLSGVPAATRDLPSPVERFAATRPFFERLVAEGFLRKCIPASVGGDCAGLVDLAILAEEFHAVDASISLTMLSTMLGLAPLVIGGTQEQQRRFLPPFLATEGAPLAAFALTEPGGSANIGSPPPGEGVRTTARRIGDAWVISGRKQWISSATGWDGQGADLLTVVCRTDADAEPSRGISIIAVPRPDSGFIFEHAFDTLGHRAHLLPRFRLDAVQVPAGNLLGQEGGGLQLAAESFAGGIALVGIFGVALMRAAFQFALSFARSERRGGGQQIIQHQAVGYALADAKTTIEAARALSWHACRAIDTAAPGALELAIHAKMFGSDAAVRVVTELMRVVGVDSYSHELPLAGLLQDAVALPLFAGGNLGVRRRQLHALMLNPSYDALATLDG
ncbi:MAG TPA: acyl-CoA dehydrogenase family protein [Aliidongia sp.]|nr:acyl-CoA dehydrogenase family protein [Aliidongia sp.]